MIIFLLVAGILLIAGGSFTAGVVRGPWVLARLMPAQGTHHVPASEIEEAFAEDAPARAAEPPTTPIFAALIADPPRTRADLPVQRRHAPSDPFTGDLPKLTEERLRAWDAEQEHRRYFGRHAITAPPSDDVTSWRPEDVTYGQARVADVLAAEDGAQQAAGYLA